MALCTGEMKTGREHWEADRGTNATRTSELHEGNVEMLSKRSEEVM